MANFRSICIIILFTIIKLRITHALYEDQIGKFDWKRSFVGKVKYANFENKRIIVATEENVLASLNIKNGNIIWRQLLEDPHEQQIQLLHVNKEVITVSGAMNSWFVRGWDINTGILLWEWTVYTERIVNSEWIIKNEKLVHIVPIVNSHLEVTTYQLKTGENRGKTTRITAPWIKDISNCAVSSSYYACISNIESSKEIYYLDVLSEVGKMYTEPLQKILGDATDNLQIIPFTHTKPAFLLLKNTAARLIFIENDLLQALPYEVSSNVVSVVNDERSLLYQLEINPENPNKLIKVTSKEFNSENKEPSIEIDYPLGLGAPYTITGQCRIGGNCDLLLSSTDNALSLLRLPEGKVIWTREEALSNIVAAEFFELPVSELDASIENEFKTSSGDVLSILYHRLSTQAKQLSSLIFGSQLLSNNGLVRDEFGLHKIIVVATNVGKLFAIDTLTGSVVWSYRLPNVKTFSVLDKNKILLFVQRTARYAPFPALCTLLAEDVSTGNGVLFQFDPITGISTKGIERLNYRIKQAMLLPYEDDNHLKPVIIISSSSDQIYVYPTSASELVRRHSSALYLYTVEPFNSKINGYRVDNGNILQINPVWEFNLGPSKLVSISTRPPAERVHSQGRVLPDRSVYYKYVNPNLIALATLTDDPIHKHVLSVYLIDGVTGLILYSTSHKKAKGPIHLVHSENWLVYTYFSERFRRTEIASAELYEGYIQSNSTAFSSHSVSQLPHVQTQSYILPLSVVSMTVTLTERGITNKFLLTALSNGAVTEVPWMLLQPRFSDMACGPEESCIPYMPEVPLPSEAIINYNQSLARVRGIQVAPARLESTSHVLVYGLDIFYTRVAPSKTFDVLKEDFEYHLIVLVLIGLIIASYITKQLASRKSLRQAWK